MTNPDYRALCAELVDELEDWIFCDDEDEIADAHSLIDRARALLAEPPAEGPTDEALANFTAWFCRNYPGPDTLIHRPEWHAPKVFRAAADAIARWGRPAAAPVAIPGEEYHEDMGPVTWWRLPVDEPPWVGTPNDSDWPGYHTHFTPAPTNPLNAHALPTPKATND